MIRTIQGTTVSQVALINFDLGVVSFQCEGDHPQMMGRTRAITSLVADGGIVEITAAAVRIIGSPKPLPGSPRDDRPPQPWRRMA